MLAFGISGKSPQQPLRKTTKDGHVTIAEPVGGIP
jgi:hypothetical protein